MSYKNSSTKSLSNHAKMKHPTAWKDILQKAEDRAKESEPPLITKIPASSDGKKYSNNSMRKQLLDEKLTRMIVDDLLPISIVGKEGFRDFVQALDPMYTPPTRKTLTEKLIPDMYKKECDDSQARYVSITTDAWTSNTTDP